MKIIIFGGSFDPIHNQHLAIINNAYKQLKPDLVLIVPSHKSPLKKRVLTAVNHRLKMIELAIADYPWIKINTCELQRQGVSYTYDTVVAIQEKYGLEHDYYLLIGSDQANQLQLWHQIEELKTKVTFVIANRETFSWNVDLYNNFNVVLLTKPFLNINASKIRKGASKALNSAVLSYINDNLLYYQERLRSQVDERRYQHCLNVGAMAVKLAKQYQVNSSLAEIAGVYHDITKQWDLKQQRYYLEKYLPTFITEPPATWHAKTAAFYLEHNLGYSNHEILTAISKHTTGDVIMSELDKIIFIADKISIERTYPEVNQFRDLAFKNLDQAFQEIFNFHYERIKNHGSDIGKVITKVYKKLNNY